jgi:hypothetical protein
MILQYSPTNFATSREEIPATPDPAEPEAVQYREGKLSYNLKTTVMMLNSSVASHGQEKICINHMLLYYKEVRGHRGIGSKRII